jgi:hypothetical protein
MPRDHNPQHSPTTAKLCNAGRLIHAVKRAIIQRGDFADAAVAYLLFVPFERANNEQDVQDIGANFAALLEYRDQS